MSISSKPENTFLIPGPGGELELLTEILEGNLASSMTAIICHPHPLFGGTMHNKVVTTLARTYKDLGIPTVRFNFRGVGKSTGTFDQGIGELQDLLEVVAWVKNSFPQTNICLAGFSFGACIVLKAANVPQLQHLVCIAPAVTRFDVKSILPITIPWVVIQGELDEVIEPQAVYDWVESVSPKPVLIRIEGAGHFFHGKLIELRTKLEQELKNF